MVSCLLFFVSLSYLIVKCILQTIFRMIFQSPDEKNLEYVVVQFYPWFKFYFPLFWGMVMSDNEFKTKGNKI